MQKRVLINGNIADQCTCDRCKRVIFIRYSWFDLYEQLASYKDSKKLAQKMNPQYSSHFSAWKDDEFNGEYCIDCIREIVKENKLDPLDIIDYPAKCFYTQVPINTKGLKASQVIYDENVF